MKRSPKFIAFRSVLLPIVHGCHGQATLAAARALAAEVKVTLVGLVTVPREASLSIGARLARQVRLRLRQLASETGFAYRARVLVSHSPWQDLLALIEDDEPDLLLLEWDEHFKALGLTPADALMRPPCNVGLVRGPFPRQLRNVLVPVRGGPHAELALRLGLSLQATNLTTLHLSPPSDKAAHADAPFRGLERVLAQLPEVHKQAAVTSDPAQTIIEQARHHDLILMGTTAQPSHTSASLGAVADRLLKESPVPLIAVKNRRPPPHTAFDETAGAQAISILVDKWFAENTFHADEFADMRHLLSLKQARGVTISLVLPALNEEATVGRVIRTVKRTLQTRTPLLDEIILMDSNSTDRTREIARAEGIPVYIHQELLPQLGPRAGKGEALWKSLLVARGDIVVWIDTDLANIHPRFVYGILGPLLLNSNIQLVKGFYRRPLKFGSHLQAEGGGRVTELTARPLLNLFYPELSGIVQPLAGEYAARRSILEQVPFCSGYGVETGLLIDVFEKSGLAAIAQVDLLERIHHSQSLIALSKMSFAIIQTVLRRLEKRHGRPLVEDVNKTMKLICHDGGYYLNVEEIIEHERPPMLTLPDYLARRSPAK